MKLIKKFKKIVLKLRKRYLHTGLPQLKLTVIQFIAKVKNLNLNSSHFSAITNLLKGRTDLIQGIDPSLILDTLCNILDNNLVTSFFSKWDGGGIYLFQYKPCPHIFYIGRTNNFKNRFLNHRKRKDYTDIFHQFVLLVGWENFSYSIIERCDPSVQIERERYWLQTYLPILNSCYNSSSAQYRETQLLKNVLKEQKMLIPKTKGLAIRVFCYTYKNNTILPNPLICDSLKKTAQTINSTRETIQTYLNTNTILKKGDNMFLFYSSPIENKNWESTLKLVLNNIKNIYIPSNVNIPVWVYLFNHEDKTINCLQFSSKTQAAINLKVSITVLTKYISNKIPRLDSNHKIVFYIFDTKLDETEISNLWKLPINPKRSPLVKVWMYDVSTFQLVNKTFFPTQTAASLFLGVSAHSINKYLDKNIAIKNKNDSLLYLCFSSEQNFEKLKAILSVTQIPTNEDARI